MTTLVDIADQLTADQKRDLREGRCTMLSDTCLCQSEEVLEFQRLALAGPRNEYGGVCLTGLGRATQRYLCKVEAARLELEDAA